jgi:glucose/mannose-6-phosphate isomerase
MFDLIYRLPEQLEDAWRLARSLTLEPSNVSWFLICGMGGSGIPGRLLSGLLGDGARILVITHNDYGLPGWADKGGLIFILSYSGQTEETLSAYQAAKSRGLAPICITSDGKLLEAGRKNGDPCLQIPAGYPPRAAIGYLFTPLLWIAARFGLIEDPEPELKEAISTLIQCRDELACKAQLLAQELLGRLIIVWTTSPLTQAVAERLRCQLNENSKVICHTNALPELDHNEIVGVGSQKELIPLSYLLILSDPKADPRNLSRAELTLKLVKEGFSGVRSISPQGQGALAHLFSFILFVDLLSYYLARLRGVDPLPVERIAKLKEHLS